MRQKVIIFSVLNISRELICALLVNKEHYAWAKKNPNIL